MAYTEPDHRNPLPTGYCLCRFRIKSILGHVAFGITYHAFDENLQEDLAIKEYLPLEVATRDRNSTGLSISESDRDIFEWGLERFLEEARTLARFQCPIIIGVRRLLRANGTTYLVMDYCEGKVLEQRLRTEHTLPVEQIVALLEPLFDGLEVLHEASVTHCGIKPDNIYLKSDGSPFLLNFGDSLHALPLHSRRVTTMATPGHAALEQCSSRGKYGSWTGIYGLGATLYRCVAGQQPADAIDRILRDELVPARQVASRYPDDLLGQIDAALKWKPHERPQSVAERRQLNSNSPSMPQKIHKNNKFVGSGVGKSSGQKKTRRQPKMPAFKGFSSVLMLLTSALLSLNIFGIKESEASNPSNYTEQSNSRSVAQYLMSMEVWFETLFFIKTLLSNINEKDVDCDFFKLHEGFLDLIDLNGDGRFDAVLDYGYFECDGRRSDYCGSGGCRIEFLLQQPGGSPLLVAHDLSRFVEISRDNEGMVILTSYGTDGTNTFSRDGTNRLYRFTENAIELIEQW